MPSARIQGRYRGDTRGDTWEIQGRYRGDAGEMSPGDEVGAREVRGLALGAEAGEQLDHRQVVQVLPHAWGIGVGIGWGAPTRLGHWGRDRAGVFPHAYHSIEG